MLVPRPVLLHKPSAVTRLNDGRAEFIRAELWSHGKAAGALRRRRGVSAWPATNSLGRSGSGATSAFLLLEDQDYVLYIPLLVLPRLLLFLLKIYFYFFVGV